MTSRHLQAAARLSASPTQPQRPLASVLSLLTWAIALLFTVCSITVRLGVRLARTITELSAKCIFYIVLGTLLFCGLVILGVLSVITLGAISLP